jgi:hypothetical protein
MEGVPDFYVEPLWQLYGMVRTPSPMCMRLQRACVHNTLQYCSLPQPAAHTAARTATR